MDMFFDDGIFNIDEDVWVHAFQNWFSMMYCITVENLHAQINCYYYDVVSLMVSLTFTVNERTLLQGTE